MKLKLAGALLAATCTVMATARHDRLRGLCGAELKQAVRDCHRPQWLYDSPSAIWPAIRLIDTGSDGMIAVRSRQHATAPTATRPIRYAAWATTP